MRAFLGIPLPAGFAPAVSALQQNLSALPALSAYRWIPPGNVHVTLRFLGEIDEAQTRTAGEALEAAAAGVPAFEVRLERFGVFPHLKNPNVLWTGPHETPEPLERLARALAERLAAAGFPPEDKPFRAHLSIARRRGRGRAPAGLEGVLDTAEGRWLHPPPAFRAAEAVLFRSELNPKGAIYAPVRRVALRGSAG